MVHISITEDHVISYPRHTHNFWEIMLYLRGNGFLYTETGNLPFEPGTIIAVPPGIEHGSVSEQGFQNISVGGAFGYSLLGQEPLVIRDNELQDGKTLAELIYRNRNAATQYVEALTSAYVSFIAGEVQMKSAVNSAVQKIISEITENACDSGIVLSQILNQSGYSEDYIRQQFKRVTGAYPTRFLTGIRIGRARFLIDVYGKTWSLAEIAEKCGYTDYVYFSKRFKEVMGISPSEYKNTTNKIN